MRIPIFTDVETNVGADEFEVGSIDIIQTVLVICFVDPKDAKISEEGEEV
jgi:hypothetical protein